MNNRLTKTLSLLGLKFIVRIIKIIRGEDRRNQLFILVKSLVFPLLAIVVFLAFWSFFAARIDTSLGRIPGPKEVYNAAGILLQESLQERAKKEEFYKIQETQVRRDSKIQPEKREYVGSPTYFDQIFTSLKTVFTGFILASLIAVPIGLLCGLNKGLMLAINPLIQIFKPISPLAWLPIVTIVISSVYLNNDGYFQKSFIISSVTVSLCSLWPTLINTAIGVDGINPDYLNLAKAFKLSTGKKIKKIILPATLPFIFAGLRISLGIGWMVLIATEMLAQNPGLGKFIWDEFQNGSSTSLAKIMVAILTIGIIGFILDRCMLLLQQLVGYSNNQS